MGGNWQYKVSSEGKKYRHEIDRIEQFKEEADGDFEKFKQKLLVRAGRCGPDKRTRFIEALKEMGLPEVAAFVRMCYD